MICRSQPVLLRRTFGQGHAWGSVDQGICQSAKGRGLYCVQDNKDNHWHTHWGLDSCGLYLLGSNSPRMGSILGMSLIGLLRKREEYEVNSKPVAYWHVRCTMYKKNRKCSNFLISSPKETEIRNRELELTSKLAFDDGYAFIETSQPDMPNHFYWIFSGNPTSKVKGASVYCHDNRKVRKHIASEKSLMAKQRLSIRK